MFWNVHGKDIIFHSDLAFVILHSMTKVTSTRTGIKCFLLEDKSRGFIIAVSHLTCIFKHLTPNANIKWLHEASFRKHSAPQAFINTLDWLLENTSITASYWGESRDNVYEFWKRDIRGCGFLQWCWLCPQLCLVCEYITFTTWGFKNNVSLKRSI